MTANKTGRPTSYTEAQVLKGIESVESGGGIPTGDSVKKAMCAELGVSAGVNAQSLGRQVERLVEDRERQQLARLVAALPASSKSAVATIASELEAGLVNHIARLHDDLERAAGARLSELGDDLADQRAWIRELLSRIDEKDVAIARAEQEHLDLRQQHEATLAENAELNARISVMEKEQDIRGQMLAMMKEALARHDSPA